MDDPSASSWPEWLLPLTDWFANKVSKMDASDWAAWVQAIGSLFAIGVAIWLGHRQHRETRALAEAQDKLALRRLVWPLLAIANQVVVVVELALEGAQEQDDMRAKHKTARLHAGVLDDDLFEMLARTKSILQGIPLHQLPAMQLVHGIELLTSATTSLHSRARDRTSMPRSVSIDSIREYYEDAKRGRLYIEQGYQKVIEETDEIYVQLG